MAKCLVDGNQLVYKACYGNKKLRTSKGVPVGGIFTFLKMMWSIKDHGSLVVAFDGGRSKERLQILPEYKKKDPKEDTEEQREIDAHIKRTFSCLLYLLPSMGIPTIKIPDQEGDDVLFRLAEHFTQDKTESVYVVSDDSDYHQFVSLGVKVYKPKTDEYFTQENFKSKYGFDYEYFTLYLSLMGTHNGVPGINGIGKVRAKQIVLELQSPTMKAIHTYAQGKSALAKRVKGGFTIAKRGFRLIDLSLCPVSKQSAMEYLTEAENKATVDVEFMKRTFKKFEITDMGEWIGFFRYGLFK